MRSQITTVAAAILLLGNSEARKQLVDADETRLKVASPLVKSETCKDYCFYGSDPALDKIYWCFIFQEPLLTLGWEYNQDANTSITSTPLKHLRFDLIFYLQSQFQVDSVMDIYRLYYNKFTAELPRVDTKFQIGMIMNERWQYCPHISWARSAVGFNGTYRQEFMNCSKILMWNPWDYNNVWVGKYAKWLEECQRSQKGTTNSKDPQVTATYWQKDYYKSIAERVIYGSVDPESRVYCYKLPGVPVYSQTNENGEVEELYIESTEWNFIKSSITTLYTYFNVSGFSKSFNGQYSLA